MTMRLRTLLGDHPGTSALKNGSLRSDLVAFDFAVYSPTNKGFKPMVREQAFDVAEMAIVTYLMARSFGKPMVRTQLRIFGGRSRTSSFLRRSITSFIRRFSSSRFDAPDVTQP